jgi:hypothetical protein
MTTSTVGGALSTLRPIDLEELIERAALQERMDRKYLLPLSEVECVLAAVETNTRVLDINGTRLFGYESVYFDTPDLTSFRLTAYRRARRFKIRTRTYVDSDSCWLEVKTQGRRGTTVKNRLEYEWAYRSSLAPGEVSPGHGFYLPGMAILETKTGSTASRVDRLLWARGHRPLRLSKYATGLAALRPDLPDCTWRRTLRRGFTSAVHSQPHPSPA